MYRADRGEWYLERILFVIAGSVALGGTALGAALSPWFLLLPALVGANLLVFALTGLCPMGILLARLGARPRLSS